MGDDGERMIARLWRGEATPAQADAYDRHVTRTVLPALARIAGHRGGYVLRREAGGAVEFLVVTFWDSMDAVRAFAGTDPEAAVVEPAARAVLSRYDSVVRHYDVVHAPERTEEPPMDFILICKDKPSSAALRQRLRGAHLEFVVDKQRLFKFGGPLLDDQGRMQGSLMVMSFPDRAGLDDYLSRDPYFTGGLFESVTIHATRQVVPELAPGLLAREIAKQKATA